MVKLMRYLKPFWVLVVVALSLVVIRVVSELYLPAITADIVNVGVVNGDVSFIVKMGIRMLLIAAIGGLSMLVSGHFAARAAAGFAGLMREEIFAKVESFSLQEFDQFGTASLITRTTNDVSQLQMIVFMGMRMMTRAPIMGIGGVAMVMSKDLPLSLIFAAAVPALFFTVFIIGRKGFPFFRLLQKKIDNLNRALRENLMGIRVIRAFTRQDYEKERFQKANKDYADTAIKVNRIMSIMNPVTMLIMNLTTICIVWFGGWRIEGGSIQVGDLMAFIQYGMHIMFSLMTVSMMFVWIPRASASAARINEVLETVPQITDSLQPQKPIDRKGQIEFKDVSFSYLDGETPVLNDISFVAPPGKVTAIVGGTGSGKTTIANLIMRFYDVDKGSISLDGIDIRAMTQKDLRQIIGYVSQRAIIFSGSVKDNLRFGRQESTEEEIEKAATIAQARNFIEAMDDGFAAEIAQGGTNLSGGQKQRLAIARAIAKRPLIYIFDDSFSALDFKTDARLRAALKEEIVSSTFIIIAQRINTIIDADQIIVLDEGRIVGIGTHKELSQNNEVYKEIVASQLAEEEIA